ncbi:probable inactive receptor kinase At2g26730 [Cucurbita maxima]|uniref:Probable inactive receptor kinase At2g26730 n=1 Tax=Cucurbita maxima TaxID=3661 RepID=A0A6J1HM84_CUCMA|nr:probable inactive receptor kinase At2g26730 [Cucurbita maxima]
MASAISLCSVFVVVLVLTQWVNSEPTQDKQALLDFLSKAPHANRHQWNTSNSVCNWIGVQCNSNQSFVYSLRLPGAGLVGKIPANTIGKLTQLRVLSLRSNLLSGKIPSDFSNMVMLQNLYLQDNAFSGEFPPSLTRLTRLTRLDLSSNNFSGTIPAAVDNLTHLTRIFLQNNGFSGSIPRISAVNLTDFNVSNNKLNGSIPKPLAKFPTSSFAGNLNLCGGPFLSCNPSTSPAPPPQNPPAVTVGKPKNRSTAAIIGIIVGGVFAAILLFLCIRRRSHHPAKFRKPSAAARAISIVEAGTSSSKYDITGGSVEAAERNKLTFFEGGNYNFDLQDLLRASAEVLGKGDVGTSYKAVLEEGTTVVVKRLKDVAATKKEFEIQMEALGKIKHQNVVPLRAFYFSNDEKLLVFDYISTGNLSAGLHGSRGSGRTPLDWDSRMRIALSVGRGLAHLHLPCNLVHGNIKSSNVLLRPHHDACITDFGLNPFFATATPPNRLAGYRAPEVLETRKVTFKSDVYSYGVLLLELLTGKAPNQQSLGEDGIDLPRWVESVVREEWTAEVFDAELMRFHNIEEEMVPLLQVAMSCVSTVPDQRPTMSKVVRMIENMNRSETDDGLRLSSDDPSKGSDVNTSPAESRTPA